MIELSGDAAESVKVIGLDESQIESKTVEQLQEMADSAGFERGKIRVMPDCHPGAGCVIGFTMPLLSRIIPNVVGVDVGCGLEAINIGPSLPVQGDELDQRVRRRVPMGTGPDGRKAPERPDYHVLNDFPWETVNETLNNFITNLSLDEEITEELQSFHDDGGYDIEYFEHELCRRAATQGKYFNVNTAISSVGTLGGGNHFIEIGQSEKTGDYWVVVHSGSRGLGEKTAQYWQDQAADYLDKKLGRTDPRADRIRTLFNDYPDDYFQFNRETVTDDDLLTWVTGGMDGDFINYDAIEPQEREKIRKELKQAIPIAQENGGTETPLDYLEGKLAGQYLIDMIFLQRYAVENRRVMAQSVADAVGVEPTDRIVSTHNYVDFRDGIIRKGAIRSYHGERAIVPFNMRDGTLIIEGKSNEECNFSLPHGAGRVMSRNQARKQFDSDQIKQDLAQNGVFATAFPTEEAPEAYKKATLIENAIEDTGQIIDRLKVVHNWKDDDDKPY